MDINKKINDLLNGLVAINNDRIEGYEKAAKETEDTDLKSMFSAMAAKSQALKSELASEIERHKGKVTEITTASGKVFRAWMDFKATVTGKDRKSILSSCEFGEDSALAAYDNVLSERDLPSDLVTLIRQQRQKLKEDRHRVKMLRDTVFQEHH